MKFSLILINILLGCSLLYEVAAQTASTGLPVDPETNKITYKDVVNQEGNPGYLYDKAIQWFGYYYLSPASVFSVQDRTNGKVEGLGRLRIISSIPRGLPRKSASSLQSRGSGASRWRRISCCAYLGWRRRCP